MSMNRKIFRFQERIGASWWWRTFADLVDRKQDDGTFRERDPKAKRQAALGDIVIPNRTLMYPRDGVASKEMMARPPGMTRQVQRALYREACKLSGIDYRGYGRVEAPRMTPEEIDALLAMANKTYDPETGTLRIELPAE